MFDERVPPEDIIGFGNSDLDSAGPTPRPIDWWLVDGYNARTYLEKLSEFVQKLVRSYVLSEQIVPRCWFKHEALILELLALQQSRSQIHYDLETGGPGGPTSWHQELALAVIRLRGWVTNSGCNGAEHFADNHASWVLPQGNAEWKVDFDLHLNTIYKD